MHQGERAAELDEREEPRKIERVNIMSLANLCRANVRRYVETVPLYGSARIYAEERPKYEDWSKDATHLMMLWVTETDRTGKTHLDKYRPDLEPYPKYKIQYGETGGARVWLNICIMDEQEYKETLARARDEAWQTIESRARWKDFSGPDNSQMTGQIDEVVPSYIADIIQKVSRRR